MATRNEIVAGQLRRVINKVLFMKKKSLFEYAGTKFYPSEVHLMLVIRDAGATNATKIADRLGVTKGAVSQTLSRLEKKGVLIKTKDPYNKNELTVTYTKFGLQAFEHFQVLTARFFQKHIQYLENFSDAEKGVIQRFLVEVEQVLDAVE
jgi:DNA-binding MarR family transcriptional regulator